MSTRYRACAAQPWSLREPSMRSGTSKRKWKSSTHRLIIIHNLESLILILLLLRLRSWRTWRRSRRSSWRRRSSPCRPKGSRGILIVFCFLIAMLSLLMVIEGYLNEVLEEYHDFNHYLICYILYHVMTSPGMHWRRSWTARTTPSQCTSLATLPSPSRLEKAKRVKVLPKKATIRGKFEGACFQLQQLNCLARQQAMLLMQLRQRRPSSNCPKFSSPPSPTLNCPKFSNTNIDCVDSVSLQML